MNDQNTSPTIVEHTIRLTSQWDFHRLPIDGQVPGERLKNVSEYLQAVGADFCGRIQLARGFGRPSGLAVGQRVDLVLEPLPAEAVLVSLNGHPLSRQTESRKDPAAGSPHQARYEVSARLEPRNTLLVELEVPPEDLNQTAGLGQVRLEILRDA